MNYPKYKTISGICITIMILTLLTGCGTVPQNTVETNDAGPVAVESADISESNQSTAEVTVSESSDMEENSSETE